MTKLTRREVIDLARDANEVINITCSAADNAADTVGFNNRLDESKQFTDDALIAKRDARIEGMEVACERLRDMLAGEVQCNVNLRLELAALYAQPVPEGWRLVPVEPTLEMAAQTAYNGTHYSDPFDFEDFKKDYAAMRDALAATAQPALPAQSEKVAHSAQWPTTPGLSASTGQEVKP